MTYLAVLIFTLAGPVAKSFEHRIHFVSQWPKALLASAATALVFVPWDIYFTRQGIWGFNSEHILGLRFAGLPIEEWGFFFVMPFACVFIHESLKVHSLRIDALGARAPVFIAGLAMIAFGVMNASRTYTLWAFVAAGVTCLFLGFIDRQKRAEMLLAYAVCLFPFYLANGVLTGAVTAHPVVWYNGAYNLGLRVGTIPVEDHFYMFAHIIPSFMVFAWLTKKIPQGH